MSHTTDPRNTSRLTSRVSVRKLLKPITERMSLLNQSDSGEEAAERGEGRPVWVGECVVCVNQCVRRRESERESVCERVCERVCVWRKKERARARGCVGDVSACERERWPGFCFPKGGGGWTG